MIVLLICGCLFLIECIRVSYVTVYNNGAVPMLGSQLYIKRKRGKVFGVATPHIYTHLYLK
jgi:hypothetical protein